MPQETAAPRSESRPAQSWTGGDLLVLAVALAISSGFRLAGLSGMLLIDDELSHHALVNHSFDQLVRSTQVSILLPGWFVLYKLWQAVVGGGEWAIRSFSLLWGLLAVACTYGAARAAAGRWAGLGAALLLAISGFHINFSQTVTPYVWLTFLGAATVWAAVEMLARGSRRAAVIHAVTVLLLVYSHQSGLLVWGAELGVGLVLWALARFRRPGRPLKLFAVTHGLTLVGMIPMAFILALQWQSMRALGTLPYLAPPTAGRVWQVMSDLLAYRSSWSWATPLALVMATGAVLATVAAARSLWRQPAPTHQHGRSHHGLPPSRVDDLATGLTASVWLVPFLFCLGGSLLVADELLYEPRFFAASIPAGAILAALTVRRAWRWPYLTRSAPLRFGLVGVLIAASVLPQAGSWAFVYGSGRRSETFPYREVEAVLTRHAQKGDLAVVHCSFNLFFFDRYYRQPWPRMVGAVHEGFIFDRPLAGLYDQADEASARQVMKWAEGHDRLWMVLTPETNRAWRDPRGLVLAAVKRQFRPVLTREFNITTGDPVRLILFRRITGETTPGIEVDTGPAEDLTKVDDPLGRGRRMMIDGEVKKAVRYFAEAHRRTPRFDQPLHELMCANTMLGRLSEAARWWDQAQKRHIAIDTDDECLADLLDYLKKRPAAPGPRD